MSEEPAQYRVNLQDYTVDIEGVKAFTGLDSAGIDGLIRKGLFPHPFFIHETWCWSSWSLQKWKYNH